MDFMLICITIAGHEHEFFFFNPKFWIPVKYMFRHILLIISTCDLELFKKLPTPMGNIMWKLEDHSCSSKRAILLQSWHFDIRKNRILCIKRMLVSRYIAHSSGVTTGGGGGHVPPPPPPNRLAIFFFLLIIEVCDVRLGKMPNTSHFLG